MASLTKFGWIWPTLTCVMAPPKRKGGRTIPGSQVEAPGTARTGGGKTPVTKRRVEADTTEASTRYTPPTVNKADLPSPMWVPVLMFGLLVVGALVIVLNYLGVLPGGTDNKYLLVGLVGILGGIVTATQYR
ncbi:MAG: hypothetical protein JWL70_681 [Acidimicrobiia bacterium]|nr:hypothetical protein [Acidimicrobiia bacterium]